VGLDLADLEGGEPVEVILNEALEIEIEVLQVQADVVVPTEEPVVVFVMEIDPPLLDQGYRHENPIPWGHELEAFLVGLELHVEVGEVALERGVLDVRDLDLFAYVLLGEVAHVDLVVD